MVTTSGLSSIKHIDEKRVVTVSSNVAQGFNAQQVLGEVKKFTSTMQLPAGYTLDYTGENEEMQESSAFMARAFTIAILLIALVLVTQFDCSIKHLNTTRAHSVDSPKLLHSVSICGSTLFWGRRVVQ